MSELTIVKVHTLLPEEATLADVLEAFESIPEEYRSEARLGVPYDESHAVIFWERPETDDERAKREDFKRRNDVVQAAREHQLLVALMKKRGLSVDDLKAPPLIGGKTEVPDGLEDQMDDDAWFAKRELALYGVTLSALRDAEAQ